MFCLKCLMEYCNQGLKTFGTQDYSFSLYQNLQTLDLNHGLRKVFGGSWITTLRFYIEGFKIWTMA